jgi:excisionase family DNA binding protein
VTDELSPSEVARRIGTTTRSVQRWIATGRLPARRVGGRWRVATDAIDAMRGSASAAARRPTFPIQTLFIANRGEIARRIARTCGLLGIRPIVAAGEGGAAVDLLSVDAIVDAARAANADALHPGYGFLAESPELAQAVADAGIRWVGPPADAIRAMGDKAAARRLASSLGIPVVAGYDGDDQSAGALARAARMIGLPLLVKPTAGGGGKGMRVVRDLSEFEDAVTGARREAQAAFGDDRVILERLVEGPRHVEVQVLFDAHGEGVHLGERDCSIQRRHQKVLEETPSPGVGPALRRRLGRDALRLSDAVGYRSAGTCEFLVDDRGRHYFLEMNTRLQVEHPVTEAVTRRDLVADQLRIAAGDTLGVRQRDIGFDGHAVEARLYAEDAEAGFLPATGRIGLLEWPEGDGIRVDAGIDQGTLIGERFDPMLAKIIVHAPDRERALDRLAAALDRTSLLGLVTNLRFLRWLVRQPAVRQGQARVDTLDRIWPPDTWAERTRIPDDAWETAASILGSAPSAGGPWAGGWRLNASARIRLRADDEQRSVRVAEHPIPVASVREVDAVHVDVGGRSVAFRVSPAPDVDQAARAAAGHAIGGSGELVAPMPGAVLAVHARLGDVVEAGQSIVTLEAMKMEHLVAAPASGRVAELDVAAGDQVTRGQVLGTIEPVI